MASAQRAHYQVSFAVLSLAAMSYSLLQSLVIPALPSLEHSLHSSADAVAWLLTGYLLSAAIATPILGRIGDMLGKEKVLVVVLVVLSAGTLISALATHSPGDRVSVGYYRGTQKHSVQVTLTAQPS